MSAPTPSGARIILRAADGTEHDVTEDVGAVFDVAAGSMDWGSGFLSVEDAAGFVRLVDLAGYHDPDRHTPPLGATLNKHQRAYYERMATKVTLLDKARAQVEAKERSR